MDSHEWNKIVGAVLGTLLLVFGIRIVSNLVFEVEEPETPGYEIAVVEEGEGEAEGAEEEAGTPLPVLLASATPDAGAAVARKCAACHSFEQGGPHKVGPNLYNTAGHDIAAHQGFAYSSALSEAEGEWTWENLDAFLEAPSQAHPGTKMSFAGLKKHEDRANVMVYLNSLTDSPMPLPEVEAEPAAAEAAPAEGEAAEGEVPEAVAPAADAQPGEGAENAEQATEQTTGEQEPAAEGTTAQQQEGTGTETPAAAATESQPESQPKALEAENPRNVPESEREGGQVN